VSRPSDTVSASIKDIGARFLVKDSTGQKLAAVYYEEDPGRRSSAKLLTRDEARRIAANVAKLWEVLAPKLNEADLVDFRSLPNVPGRNFEENGDHNQQCRNLHPKAIGKITLGSHSRSSS
jgi:hypothetical protein